MARLPSNPRNQVYELRTNQKWMVLSSGQGGIENFETDMKPGDQMWGLTTPSVPQGR